LFQRNIDSYFNITTIIFSSFLRISPIGKYSLLLPHINEYTPYFSDVESGRAFTPDMHLRLSVSLTPLNS